MQSMGSQSLIDRMMGVARLDVGTYEEIEHDTNAMAQAATVVVIAAIASGIGSLREDGITGLIVGAIASIVGWLVFSLFVYFVGTRILAAQSTEADTGQVLRVLGFAYTPQILAVGGVIPGIGWLIAFIGSIWFLVTSVIGVRQAMEMSTGRAIVTIIVAGIAEGIVIGIIAGIFGVAIWGLGG